MASLHRRLQEAMNSHNADNLAALFSADYRSSQPIHPNRGFGGSDQVHTNWTWVFQGVPDFHAELLASVTDGDTEWGEWEWRGTHRDGSSYQARGVTIILGRDGLIAEARLYMEPVEVGGADINTAMQELYKPQD
jgi:hypothetical protein